MSPWFSTGLAVLQSSFWDYVSPTTGTLPGTYVLDPETTVDRAMCHLQKIQTTKFNISFSVLGLAIILIVGTLLILTSFILEKRGRLGRTEESCKLHLGRQATASENGF